MLKGRFTKSVTLGVLLLQLFSSTAYAGFLYLPFSKSYPPSVYVYDSYTLSKGWPTYYNPAFGGGHTGTDYRGDGYGTPIYAAADGTVVAMRETENDGCDITYSQQLRYGNYVKIDHQVGSVKYRTEYWHLKQNGVVVSVGQKVKTGQLIAYISNSGLTAGADCKKRSDLPFGANYHLHFEAKKWNGKKWVVVNPYNEWTGWLWVGNPPLPATGYLIRNPTTGEIFFLENGVRRWVPDSGTLGAIFYSLPYPNVSPGVINSIPRGPDVPSIHNGWVAAYYNNPRQQPPVFVRAEAPNKNWGTGSPDPRIRADHFSARFAGIFDFPLSGPYTFHGVFDDVGIMYFDHQRVLNYRFRCCPASPQPVWTMNVSAGRHIIHLDFTEDTGGATARLWWDSPDKTGPQVSASFGVGAQGGGWFTTSVPVTISASDPSGIAEIAYQVGPPRDPDGWTRVYNKTSTSFTISGEGIHELYFNAKDKNNNWGKEGFEVIPIDFTPPVTAFSYDGPSYQDEGGKLFVSPETPFSLEAEDELSGVEDSFFDYGGGSEIFEEPFSLPKELGDGRLNIRYHSTDVAGNVELENSQEVYLDSTPPNSSDNSDGGWHNEDVVVTITADDGEGAGVQAIYYWINDDQEEVAEGDQVLVLFEDEGAYELSYYAVDNVENVEGEIHLALVKIDKTPPTIEGFRNHEPNKYGWYNEDVVVHFVAEDQPDLSGLNSESVTPDITISTEGKDQEVTGVAEDNAGNTASVTVGGINIDKADPNSEITFPEEGEYYNAESWEGEVQGIAHDNLSGIESVEVEIVGREAGDAQLEDYGKLETGWEYSLEFAEDGSDDGYYTIHSSATDLAGNQELIQESTNEVAFVFDNTPPTSEIVDVEDHHYINGRGLDEGVNLEFTAEDNIALQNARLYKRYEGGEWDYHSSTKRELGTKAEGVFTVKTLHLSEDSYKDPNREGLWEFSSSAKDKAQNCENQENCRGPLEVEEPDTWIIYDITPPTSAIASLEEGAYYNAESWPGIAGAASDATPKGSEITTSGVAQVEVQVLRDGAVVVDWTTADGIEGWTFEGFPFEDGVYLIYSRATDRAENQEETFEISFTYDNTAPVSTITSVEGGAYYNATTWPGIFGEAGDNLSGVARVEVRIDKDGEEGEWFAWEDVEGWSQWTVPGFIPSDGFFTIYSRATDKANNTESTFIVSFVYDNTPPAAPTASIPGGTFIEGETLTVSLSAEEGAEIYYLLGAGEPLPYSGAIIISDNTTLSAYAVDKAGNRSASVEFGYVFNPVPQVLGVQEEDGGEEIGESGEVEGEETAAAVGEADGETNPEGLNVWPILLMVLIGGVPYLFLRRRISSGR